MTKGRIEFAVLILLTLCAALAAQVPASFDYYVLSLSWAPEFCAQPGAAGANPKECAAGRGTSFIVHGLWPEAARGKNPESCGPARPVARNVVNIALPYMLSASLIQHEWATHGSCTGLNPADYFFAAIQARSAIQIPVQMISVEVPVRESPAQIEARFEGANTAFPKGAFHVACRNGSLTEVRVCFSRDLKPAACPSRAGECSEPAVNIRPVR
jgi:ribonuclease T2